MAGELAVLVGRNIERGRSEHPKRYNQRELAERIRELDPRLAATNQRVSNWETGKEKPGDRYMRLIAQVLDRPLDWFYRDHDGPAETPDPFASDGSVGIPEMTAQLAELTQAVRNATAPPDTDLTPVLERLDRIEETLQSLGADLEVRAAAIVQQIEASAPPKPESRKRRRA